MHTPVLVLDEPMAGLDPRGRRELLELLTRLQRDRDLTLVVCSASLSDASLLCDRFVFLDGGRTVMDGSVREVLRDADQFVELDITLIDTGPLIHKMDARIKLVATFVFIVASFLIDSFLGFVLILPLLALIATPTRCWVPRGRTRDTDRGD